MPSVKEELRDPKREQSVPVSSSIAVRYIPE
jgi:hypothetical protein